MKVTYPFKELVVGREYDYMGPGDMVVRVTIESGEGKLDGFILAVRKDGDGNRYPSWVKDLPKDGEFVYVFDGTEDEVFKFVGDAMKKGHLEWFKDDLIEAGATDDVTDDQVRASAGYAHSEKSFIAGCCFEVKHV